MQAMPIGVLARPGARVDARKSVAARCYPNARLRSRDAAALMDGPSPRWCFVNLPLSDQSSTALRNSGAWD